MSVIAIFSGVFCRATPVILGVSTQTGFRIVTEKDIIARAATMAEQPESKMASAFDLKASVFNRFTHEHEHALAYLRWATAEILADDRLVLTGYPIHFIPKEIRHVLRVCLTAGLDSRVLNAKKERLLSQAEALKYIEGEDRRCVGWAAGLDPKIEPWNPDGYGLMLWTDKISTADAVAAITTHVAVETFQYDAVSKRAVMDFLLAARVEAALARAGHIMNAACRDNVIFLTIAKQVLRPDQLLEEVKGIIGGIPEVRAMEMEMIIAGQHAEVYRKYDCRIPSKVLLVDDEREFVLTLAERLIMRDMGTAVAHDGETALAMVQTDDPDVMILDLNMNGIHGIEVLRKAKSIRPEIEVIILTGHGSETDKEICMGYGAFAYLQKPVDIQVLSDAIQQANAKINRNSTWR